MTSRIAVLTLLLLGAFGAGTQLSEAPLRVDLVHLLTWYPPLLGGAAIVWSRRLKPFYKALALVSLFAVAGWVALVASTRSIGKIEVHWAHYVAGLSGWAIALPVFILLSEMVLRLVERVTKPRAA